MSGIFNANSRPLSSGTPSLPNMREAMLDWFQVLTFTLIRKETINFQLVETKTPITFRGIVQNGTPSTLEMKPEGQRKWDYIDIWATPELKLGIDDVFGYMGKNYRIISKNDWSQYGYNQFQAVEDYR